MKNNLSSLKRAVKEKSFIKKNNASTVADILKYIKECKNESEIEIIGKAAGVAYVKFSKTLPPISGKIDPWVRYNKKKYNINGCFEKPKDITAC